VFEHWCRSGLGGIVSKRRPKNSLRLLSAFARHIRDTSRTPVAAVCYKPLQIIGAPYGNRTRVTAVKETIGRPCLSAGV
jgi:hypothetical protein